MQAERCAVKKIYLFSFLLASVHWCRLSWGINDGCTLEMLRPPNFTYEMDVTHCGAPVQEQWRDKPKMQDC
jgi:hypothetical protein